MIILCAGGTGGHVFPAEGLASVLKKRGHKLGLLTDSRAMNFVNYEYFDSIEVLNVRRDNFFIYFFTMFKSLLKSLRFIYGKNARVVIGFGGYPSVPGMIAGRLFFKKILIHEQNAVLGRANKFLQPFSKGLATSFLSTQGAPSKAVWIGNPVRRVVHAAMAKPRTKDYKKFNICVTGGSQGARLFSDVVPKAIELLPVSMRQELFITQQCRSEQLNEVKTAYEKLSVSASLESFFSDITSRLKNADLAICRAGASTISELTCLGVPAILVPLAISKDNDQGENARVIANAGGAWVIKESELNPVALAQIIENSMNNRKILESMSESIHHLAKPNAAEDLADWVENFL